MQQPVLTPCPDRRTARWAALAFGAAALAVPALAAAATCSASKDLFLNPFNAESAHHRPIGTGARYAPDDHPATRDWQQAAHFNVNAGTPWGTSVAATTADDPMVTVEPQAYCDKVVDVPVTLRLPAAGFATRVKANHSGCPDGVVVIYDRTTETPHQLRQYDWNGGKPTAGQYRTWDIKGLGHGTRDGERIGTSASGVAGLFGVLRGHEINTRGYKIEHALRMGLPRKPGADCKVMLSNDVVLPATGRDRSAKEAANNVGNIPYGGLLALPPGVDLEGLGLSEPGQRLAEAIRDYGIYVGDGGGCNAGAIEADQEVDEGIRKQLREDIRKFYPLIRLVLNNDVLGSAVAGGGEPLAPNCAFDAS
jgi:hypothetical protein